MNISYDSYRVFYYAAKYRSFSQAAAALYSNQPNVTRMIRKLESELGCALFFRHKGKRRQVRNAVLEYFLGRGQAEKA